MVSSLYSESRILSGVTHGVTSFVLSCWEILQGRLWMVLMASGFGWRVPTARNQAPSLQHAPVRHDTAQGRQSSSGERQESAQRSREGVEKSQQAARFG